MENNKRVWIINQYTGSPYHGMNYRSYYIAKELIKSGKEITIFSSSYSHLFIKEPNTNGLFTEEIIDDINYIWVKTPKYKGSKSLGRVFNMFVFMLNLFFFNIFKKDKPDVIIISSLSLFPVINAYLWSKIFKIDFIFEVRDLWPLSLIELGNISTKHPLVLILSWFEKLGYKKAKFVVSLLSNSKEYMINKGMHGSKFIHIPNGLSLKEANNNIKLDEDIIRQFPKNKFIVGYLGTVGIANALEFFIKAVELLKYSNELHFVIVGNGGQKEELKKYCKDNYLTNITFINAVSKLEVQSILELFDICYIGWHNRPIYEYGISANKIFDYMYSGKPILHSISTENDIVEMANCGITVEAENIEDIVSGILKFYKMPKERLFELGLNGKNYVQNNHSYENLVKKYLEIL